MESDRPAKNNVHSTYVVPYSSSPVDVRTLSLTSVSVHILTVSVAVDISWLFQIKEKKNVTKNK